MNAHVVGVLNMGWQESAHMHHRYPNQTKLAEELNHTPLQSQLAASFSFLVKLEDHFSH
jgi:hypothetical protein